VSHINFASSLSGLSTNPSSTSPTTQTATGSTDQIAPTTISNLSPGTYYYQTVSEVNGVPVYGEIESFTIASEVVTFVPTSVDGPPGSATFAGAMTIPSGAAATVEYVYAPTLAGLASSPVTAGSPQQVVGTGAQQLLAPVTEGSIPTGSYYVQAVVTLPGGGKVYGSAQPFAIANAAGPVAVTGQPSAIDSTATMVDLQRQNIPIVRGAHWTPEVHEAWAAALLQRIEAR
jgi:hypothetical protein